MRRTPHKPWLHSPSEFQVESCWVGGPPRTSGTKFLWIQTNAYGTPAWRFFSCTCHYLPLLPPKTRRGDQLCPPDCWASSRVAWLHLRPEQLHAFAFFFLSGELGFGSGAIFCSCASAPKFPKLGASARSARSGDKFRTHRVLGDERQLLELMQAYDGTDEIALPLLCSVRRSH